jgi:hypothetical protein
LIDDNSKDSCNLLFAGNIDKNQMIKKGVFSREDGRLFKNSFQLPKLALKVNKAEL